MPRILVIERCADCLWCIREPDVCGGPPVCSKVSAFLQDTGTIPDWCLLPEAPMEDSDATN